MKTGPKDWWHPPAPSSVFAPSGPAVGPVPARYSGMTFSMYSLMIPQERRMARRSS